MSIPQSNEEKIHALENENAKLKMINQELRKTSRERSVQALVATMDALSKVASLVIELKSTLQSALEELMK